MQEFAIIIKHCPHLGKSRQNHPTLSGGQSNWRIIRCETRRLKNHLVIENGELKINRQVKGYMISPGANDGIADSFGRGDIWFLWNRPNQSDDGVQAIGPPYEALIDNFVNHELIKNKDVVVWYGAHFTHTTKHDDDAASGHIVGPDLRFIGLVQ